MYFTRETQIAPEEIEANRNVGVATATAEPANEYDPGVLGRVFSGSPGEPPASGTKRLLRSPALSSRSNSGLRVIALSRAQQTSGNCFVQRLVNRAHSAISAAPLIQRQCSCGACEKCGISARAPHAISDTVGRSSYFSAGGYAPQASLLPGALAKDVGGVVVGDPNDPLEHEADRMADAASQSTLQRKDAGSSAPTSSHVSSNLNVGESGSPLQHNVREKVEPVLGADLSQVRVHDGPSANEAAAGLDAKAFTHENHIWLGPQQSASDVRLMAHEATHVVQQTAGNASAPQPTIQRQFGWAHTQHPNQPAYPRPPDPYPSGLQCDQRALAAMHTETVELKGVPDFRPSYWMAEGLYCARPDAVSVRVRFGKLASGVLRIRMANAPTSITAPGARTPMGPYETVDDFAFIDLTHPAFPGAGALAPPRMYLKIRDSVVTGIVSFIPYGAKISLADLASYQRAQTFGQVLGWRGLVDVKPGSVVNEVKDGVLRFALESFTFGMQDLQGLAGVTTEQADYTGTGNFSVTDEATSFSAETVIKAEGASEAKMPLHRAQGKIFGTASLNLTMSPRDAFGGTFSGSLQGAYTNGVMSIKGTARYRSAKLNGTVTVLIAPRGVAWTEVMKQLPTGAPGITAGAALAPGHVVVGWGSLDFHINEWLTGHASVVVDPEGYITSHGILRPTVEYQFLDEPGKLEATTNIAHLSPPALTIATVGIASLNGTIEADLKANGKIGPARLYGLEIEGQFSTRPGVVFTGRITGRANLSAQASLGASLTGSLHGSIGTPPADVQVITVTLGITGQATLRAYVELQPTFERIAGPNPDEAQYKITGTLSAGGAVSLALGGFVKFSILHHGPKISLGKVQYPLGSVAADATFSHVLGSKKDIEIAVTSTDFNDAQYTGFVQDLFDEDAPENEGDHDVKLGQKGGVPPPTAPHPTEFRTTFTMNGVPHTLWLEHTPGPVLKMASNGDDSLDTKLRNEIAQVDQQRKAQDPGDEADLLAAEERSASSLLSQSISVEHALKDLESEARANPDAAGLNEIASGLTTYATQYGKTDLAQAPPTPTPGPADVVIEDGRYQIKNRAQLEAVRKARPTKPFDLDPSLDQSWTDYLKYFDERIRLIDKDLTPPKRTLKREPPSTWEKYLESRATYDPMRQKKEFQETLKKTINDREGDIKPEQIEIDVGLKKRSDVGYADVVITDAQNNLTVYSAKVRNVLEQVRKLTNPTDVEKWIASQLRSDIKEAIDYYGGTVQVRRKGHPLYGQSVFVKQVILVWDSRVVPSDYHSFVLTRGNQLGVEYRKTISAQVQLQP